MPYSSISRLALQAEFFLDLKLDRQPVGVPAALALHPEPLHGSIAAYDVFEDPRKGVVYSGTAVGRGWALIHHEKRERLGRSDSSAPEDVFFLPLLQDVGVQLGEIDATRYGLKHRGKAFLLTVHECETVVLPEGLWSH